MADALRWPPKLTRRLQHGFFEDFFHYVTADRWTSLVEGNATVAVDADATGGVVVINTVDATDNIEAGFKTTAELFLAAAGKPIFFEALVKFTDMASNQGNVAVGLADVFADANTLLDDGGGPPATFYGAMFYKVDGGTVWRVASSAGALASTGATSATAYTAGGAWQKLGIRFDPTSGAFNSSTVTYFIDGLPACDERNRPIAHTVAHAAVATGEMNAGVYAKAGIDAANFEVLTDYITAWQKR